MIGMKSKPVFFVLKWTGNRKNTSYKPYPQTWSVYLYESPGRKAGCFLTFLPFGSMIQRKKIWGRRVEFPRKSVTVTAGLPNGMFSAGTRESTNVYLWNWDTPFFRKCLFCCPKRKKGWMIVEQNQKTGTLYGISVGSGDPELMTVKAVRILEKCAVWAAPAAKQECSVAPEIARGSVSGEKKNCSC